MMTNPTNKFLWLSSALLSMLLVSCGGSSSSLSSSIVTDTSSNSSSNTSSEITSEGNPLYDPSMDTSYRQERSFAAPSGPSHTFSTDALTSIDDFPQARKVSLSNQFKAMIHGQYRLDFTLNQANKFYLQVIDISGINDDAPASSDRIMFENATPIRIFINGSSDLLSAYDTVEEKPYGYLAKANLMTSSGSVLAIEDAYYIAVETEIGTFNVKKSVKVISFNSNDKGFASEFALMSPRSENYEYFVPNNIFKSLSTIRSFRETQLGLPMMMMRSLVSGYTLSISRYQPVIHYENNGYASLEANPSTRSITVIYPSKEGNRKYHTITSDAMHVYDITMRVEDSPNYEEASANVYNAHFNLQNQRIVATDIDEVYQVINEDYKTFLHAEEQQNVDTGKKYTSYGLPWRIHIQDGQIGPYTYQAGFIGQQIPSAYNMMLYGLMHDDLTSLQNGLNVIDFWIDDAEMMSIAGVPHIWYDTWADDFRAYPCFIRMAVDAMEGLLDAYRVALAHNIERPSWFEALTMFADFLAYNQNEDGSYYRTYNYDGGPFVSWDNGIEEPPGNIVQSFSKSSSAMPIRFLGKIYELTGNDLYKDAAINAGNYVYENLYPTGYYQGGTCDNPNAIDKEAGVFAMYAYDTLYTLTGETKWLTALKQATAFTMSTVIVTSFSVRDSDLKAAKPVMAGYTDGLSFINCSANSGVDNYISFIYYQLFRNYIHTGDNTYLKQAEFVQQNTKSIMDWDGSLNYPYRSLVAEASSVTSFNFSSADDGVWVTWSSAANAEPIAKMYTNFGSADVAQYRNTDIELLREHMLEIGCGGKHHIVFENTIVSRL